MNQNVEPLPDVPPTEFNRFKDFTRRILAVPKSEINEAEKTLPPLKRGRKASEKRESG